MCVGNWYSMTYNLSFAPGDTFAHRETRKPVIAWLV
jgi:hypothetical protein